MNNKKLVNGMGFFIMLLFMMLIRSVLAQEMSDRQNKTPEDRAQFQTTWMTKNLNLDSSQVDRVQLINLKYAQKNEPILKSGASNLSKFKKLKSLQDEKDAEIKKVFTPDQFKQYESLKEELKEDMKEKIIENGNQS